MNVSHLVEEAKVNMCRAEETCDLEDLGQKTESEPLAKRMILLAAANEGSWDWRYKMDAA